MSCPTRTIRSLNPTQLVLLLICAFCLGYLASDADRPNAVLHPKLTGPQAVKQRELPAVVTKGGGASQSIAHRIEQRHDAASHHGGTPATSARAQEQSHVFTKLRPLSSTNHVVQQRALPKEVGRRRSDARSFRVNVVIVLCGDRLAEVKTLIKSIVHFSRRSELAFYLFADEALLPDAQEYLRTWNGSTLPWVTYDVRPLAFPSDAVKTWKKLFRMCASQRLFIPDLLLEVNRAIYLDTDTLLVRDIADLWDYFDKFNATHLSAMIKEGEVASVRNRVFPCLSCVQCFADRSACLPLEQRPEVPTVPGDGFCS